MFGKKKKPRPHQMFLTPKKLIKPFDDVWISNTTMGKNTITSMYDVLPTP